MSGTELATASHSSTLSMRPSRSRSQLTPAPAIAMLPSSAYWGGSSGPNWYACNSQLPDCHHIPLTTSGSKAEHLGTITKSWQTWTKQLDRRRSGRMPHTMVVSRPA